METLSELYLDLGRGEVSGEGFAAPQREVFTDHLWIGVAVVITASLSIGILLWRRRRVRASQITFRVLP